MNEKQIEIALAKLRKAWKQTKTKVGKERIEFVAKTLKQGISGALIPLSFSQRVDMTETPEFWYGDSRKQGSSDSVKPFNPDALDLKVDDAGNVRFVWA